MRWSEAVRRVTSEPTAAPLRDVEMLREQNVHLRRQLSRLSRLTYRVASSLDLPLVLQEVVDAACELTGARYGALALLDEEGEFQRLFTRGLSEEQRANLGELPHGRGILGLLPQKSRPWRIADLSKHERFVGFPDGHPAMTTFLGANIQDQGAVEGTLYLADKAEGRQFSREDEELLAVFAQQAAAAIRNARRFEEEKRARAGAEAAHEAIRQSEDRLERLRTDLLAGIAHEFRTPLTAIRTAVGILQDPALSATHAQEKRLLQTISQSATLMQRLVTDFVDLARFQSGTIRPEIERFDARVLAREAVRAMNALFASRQQTVIIDAPKYALWVHGDRRRLEQALLNLLSNAQKYAPEGSAITVKTALRDHEALWTVIDEGPGIPVSAQPYLFERFFTLPEADSGKSSGTGLGLPIAMAIARAHGGTIDVDSVPGQGSAFTLRVAVKGAPDRKSP
jgi:signal transduction histidine kinase